MGKNILEEKEEYFKASAKPCFLEIIKTQSILPYFYDTWSHWGSNRATSSFHPHHMYLSSPVGRLGLDIPWSSKFALKLLQASKLGPLHFSNKASMEFRSGCEMGVN